MKADSKAKQSIALGRARAKHTLQQRDKALKRRVKAVGAKGKTAASLPNAKRAALTRAAGGAASNGTLVAEGDSWFDYPLADILDCLEDSHGYDVDSVAHRGDRVEDMAYAEDQLDDLVRTIERQLRRNIVPKAILLSGGGNDIAGDEFAMLLNHRLSPQHGLNESIVHGVIEERLRESYLTILSAVTEISRARIGTPIRIVLHGYAHAVPDGRGFMGGWGPLPGPWLEPSFAKKRYPVNERQDIVDTLIDRFNAMLADVVSSKGFEHVRYVDLRDELPNGKDYKTWWANELHPTRRGFERVADKIAGSL